MRNKDRPHQKPYFYVERISMRCPAAKKLTGKSLYIYLEFLQRRIIHTLNRGKSGKESKVCTNARQLEFTYSDAEKNHDISERQFRAAIKQLVKYGFIDIVQQGGYLCHYKTVYGLSERWRDIK